MAFSQIFEESVQLLVPRVATLDAQSVANAPGTSDENGLRMVSCRGFKQWFHQRRAPKGTFFNRSVGQQLFFDRLFLLS